MKKLDVPLCQTVIFVCAVIATTRSTSAATDTWIGSTDSKWSSPGNWTGGNAPPIGGDSLIFGASTPTTLTNDLTAGLAFNGLTIAGGAPMFTLNGNSVLVSGQTNGNIVAFVNSSGLTQTNLMSLALDWGYYTFSSPSGGNLALNGGLSLNPGGVAYFDANVTSSSLSSDSAGLISGLGGAGLMFSGSAPTDLAAISGGTISAYSAYTAVASGAISSGNNIELTANGVAASYTAANISVNTIRALQAGNSGGTFTDALTITGSLTLGTNGGIYVLDSGAGNKACLNVTGGTVTAGASGPATLVFGVNGTTTGNQLSVNSKLTNNAGGGAVTVVTTGPGSLFFAVANSYSGGTYVSQGQLQANNISAFGFGPVNVASGATVFLNQAGNWTNNFFLSPGSGAPITGVGAANGAGALEVNNNDTLSGRITLLGAPVTAPPGNRLNSNVTTGNETVTGQITGTGTLEIYGYHSTTWTLQNTSLVNPNNWQGGLILGGKPGSAVNVFFKVGATNQIPSGPNAGSVTLIPATLAVQSRFDLNGFNTTINGLIGTSANAAAQAQLTSFGAANCTLTLGANDATAQFNGTVSDSGVGKALSLNKIGTGTQTFAGAMTHFGTTTISAGNLTLTGSANPANSPTIKVAAGATLDGSSLNAGGLTVGVAQTLNCAGTVVGNTTINGSVMSLDAIGTLTNSGNLSFNGGGSYVWHMNNATGTAGTDSGWSLINVINGGLQINSSSGSPFNIKVTSLTPGDVPGNAANFSANVSASWTIAQSASPITGFDPSAFHIDSSAFSNPQGSGGFNVALSGDQLRLLLTFTATPVVTTPLVNQTNCPGSTAVFTAVANGAPLPLSFQWLQGSTVLNNGDTTASGATVAISGTGHTNIMTLTGVQDPDAGGYTVIVTNTSTGAAGISSAALVVIDPPSGLSVAQSPSSTVSAGGIVRLTVTTAGGTAPFTYAWSRNGTSLVNGGAFSGANTATLAVDASPATAGSYTVLVGTACGSATSDPSIISNVTSVAGQIIYEPFTSYVGQPGPSTGSDTWEGMTNLFNELTGEPAWWFHSSGSGIKMNVIINDMNNGSVNQFGGSYPWPGLAGNSANCLYWTTSLNSHLEFQQGGFAPGSTVYFSCILNCVSLGSVDGVTDVIAGFVSPNDGTAFNYKLCTVVTNHAANQYSLGVGKGDGTTGAQGVDANTIWAPTPILSQQNVLVVGCYTVVSGGTTATDDTVSLWINPDPSTFNAGFAPAPTVGPVSFGVKNSRIRDFGVHSTSAPVSHRIADLRIGTTWASVTPPAAPTLTLANVYAPVGSTANFASQNAGNPVDSYQWQFNGGPALSDNAHYAGTATATLTISNVTAADEGTYTVTGINTDPLPPNGMLTNSASAILSTRPPSLRIFSRAPNVLISWPTNWTGFLLEQSPNLSPAAWTTNSLPPYPIAGSNNAVSTTPVGTEYFRLIKH